MIVLSNSKGRYGRIDRTQSLEILSLNHNVNTIQCSTIQYRKEKKRKEKEEEEAKSWPYVARNGEEEEESR